MAHTNFTTFYTTKTRYGLFFDIYHDTFSFGRVLVRFKKIWMVAIHQVHKHPIIREIHVYLDENDKFTFEKTQVILLSGIKLYIESDFNHFYNDPDIQFICNWLVVQFNIKMDSLIAIHLFYIDHKPALWFICMTFILCVY